MQYVCVPLGEPDTHIIIACQFIILIHFNHGITPTIFRKRDAQYGLGHIPSLTYCAYFVELAICFTFVVYGGGGGGDVELLGSYFIF